MKWAIASIAVLLASAPRIAGACEPLPPGIGYRTVTPADGATLVPINTEVWIDYLSYDGSLPLADIELRRGSRLIPVTVRMLTSFHRAFVVQPSSPLDPDTTYEVWTRIPTVPCVDSTDCVSTDWSRLSSFTTGARRDDTAPRFRGVLGGVTRPVGGPSDCGDYEFIQITLQWLGAIDESPVRYVIHAGSPDGPVLTELAAGQGYRVCWSTPEAEVLVDGFVSDSPTYSVRAIDLAGNEDDNVATVTLDVSCPSPIVDAGPMIDSPISTPDGATTPPDPHGSGGCEVAHHHRSSCPIILFVVGTATLRGAKMLRHRARAERNSRGYGWRAVRTAGAPCAGKSRSSS
jgi:hypothetical protein